MKPEQIQRLRELEAAAKESAGEKWTSTEPVVRFLNAAWNDASELLDDWERMRAENQRLKETLDGFVESYTNDSRIKNFLDDGFGNVWAKCDRADCQLQIVRPGKVQCSRCEEEASND